MSSKYVVTVSQEKDFIVKINEVIKPLNLKINVGTFKNINTVLEQIRQSSNEKLLTSAEKVTLIDNEHKIFLKNLIKWPQIFLSELL
ncbi:MAG: hypothetical protein LBV69_08455 [Bacteroidales bacterium]|jgi:hypothetical protein|nr:hypothetical protein [Bacteroidales bacterium]